jgi:hypothetical protein
MSREHDALECMKRVSLRDRLRSPKRLSQFLWRPVHDRAPAFDTPPINQRGYTTTNGSIIATIITLHLPRNDAAAPGHLCPGTRTHAIDIVQPPNMGISPIADMAVHHTIVTAGLAAKTSTATPKKDRWEASSEVSRRERSLCVLVLRGPPGGAELHQARSIRIRHVGVVVPYPPIVRRGLWVALG